jgi:acetyl esterase
MPVSEPRALLARTRLRNAGGYLPMRDRVTGRTYLERGQPVVVLRRWGGTSAPRWAGIPLVQLPRSDGKRHTRSGPHNVLIQRADGSRVVRPFRGLRL